MALRAMVRQGLQGVGTRLLSTSALRSAVPSSSTGTLAGLRERLAAEGPDFGDFLKGDKEYSVYAPLPKVQRHTRKYTPTLGQAHP
eukprot:1179539-Prorocentrum_minimum.AAC.2